MRNSIQNSYGSQSRAASMYDDDRPGDKPKWIKVSPNYNKSRSRNSWGSRNSYGASSARSMW